MCREECWWCVRTFPEGPSTGGFSHVLKITIIKRLPAGDKFKIIYGKQKPTKSIHTANSKN